MLDGRRHRWEVGKHAVRVLKSFHGIGALESCAAFEGRHVDLAIAALYLHDIVYWKYLIAMLSSLLPLSLS